MILRARTSPKMAQPQGHYSPIRRPPSMEQSELESPFRPAPAGYFSSQKFHRPRPLLPEAC